MLEGDYLCCSALTKFSYSSLPTSAEFYDEEGKEVDINFGGLRGRGVKKQDPAIERDLYLSLEDLFFGCTKKIKISRRVSFSLTPGNPQTFLLPARSVSFCSGYPSYNINSDGIMES